MRMTYTEGPPKPGSHIPSAKYHHVQAASLYEQIVEQIKERILTNELKEGERLPNQRELARQFGVSRTVVREAVTALTREGLVDVRVGRGMFVIHGSPRIVKRSLGTIIRLGQVVSSRHLVEIREMLEPQISAMAARRATEENIAKMREAVMAMDAALNDMDAYIAADLAFHLALADATQNVLIRALIDPIIDLLDEQRKRIFSVPGGPERGQHHHKCILDAITRADPGAAEEAARDHLRQIAEDTRAATLEGPIPRLH